MERPSHSESKAKSFMERKQGSKPIQSDKRSIITNSQPQPTGTAGKPSSSKSIFQEDSRTEDIPKEMVNSARVTGVLNLSSKELINVPDRVWKIKELDEAERRALCSVSFESSSEETTKWWEFEDLKKLIIANNFITDIPPNIGALVALQVFDAHDNQIRNIDKNIGCLDNLTKFDISKNKIKKLPNELYSIKRLTELKLSDNQIEELSDEVCQLNSLQLLDMSFNDLTNLPGALGFLSHLIQLNLSNNKIKEIPPDFSSLTGLRVFDISHNCITNLSNCVTHMPHLEILSLQNNKLSSIPDLEGCVMLRELFIQNNLITSVDSKMFRTTKIQLLDFRYNKINALEIDIDDLDYLDRLYLNNNELLNLPDSIALLRSLKQITLEGNPLRGIRVDVLQRGTTEILKYLKGRIVSTDQPLLPASTPPKASSKKQECSIDDLRIDIHKLKNTKTLMLVGRNITSIDNSVFITSAEAKVSVIDVSRNGIAKFSSGFAQVCPFLTELKLDFNKFTELPADIAISCTNLQFLSFQNNQISGLPKELTSLKKIREINLSYNKFEELPACLYELPLVEIIIAANNKINCVDVKGLEKLTMLAVLDLRNNSISHIPPELGLLTQLRSLNIEGNSFRVPGYSILNGGTQTILSFLRNKVVATK